MTTEVENMRTRDDRNVDERAEQHYYAAGNKSYYTFGDKAVYINGERVRGMVVERDDLGNEVRIQGYACETRDSQKKPSFLASCFVYGLTIAVGLGIGIPLADPIATGIENVQQRISRSTDREDVTAYRDHSRGSFINTTSNEKESSNRNFLYSVIPGDAAWKIEDTFNETYPECHNPRLTSEEGKTLGNLIEVNDIVHVDAHCYFD